MNWVVLNPSGYLFYEAVSSGDAQNQCPKGYSVRCVSNKELGLLPRLMDSYIHMS